MTVDLSEAQQSQYLRLILRYYEVFHPFKALATNEIFVYGFNKTSTKVTDQLMNELLLFLSVAIKL